MMEQCKASADHARGNALSDAALISLESTFIEFFQEGQAQERRRITREIHDSTMQLLSCLSLALARLKQPHRPRQTGEIIQEMEELLIEAQSELRTLSYLANPPPLEALGLHAALQALVEGFGRRSGLKATLRWEGETDSPSHESEFALYRVVQEALSNVHRHARAAHVVVAVASRPDLIEVSIRDDGLGMPMQPAYGVGLSGMRARLDEVGGCLAIRPASPGTELVAAVPVRILEPAPMTSAQAKLLALRANCHHTADRTADQRIAAALREMAGDFGSMAAGLGPTDGRQESPEAPFIPAIPLRPDP